MVDRTGRCVTQLPMKFGERPKIGPKSQAIENPTGSVSSRSFALRVIINFHKNAQTTSLVLRKNPGFLNSSPNLPARTFDFKAEISGALKTKDLWMKDFPLEDLRGVNVSDTIYKLEVSSSLN